MRKRLRLLLVAAASLLGIAVVLAPSAGAFGGCVPHVDWETLEIYKVC